MQYEASVRHFLESNPPGSPYLVDSVQQIQRDRREKSPQACSPVAAFAELLMQKGRVDAKEGYKLLVERSGEPTSAAEFYNSVSNRLTKDERTQMGLGLGAIALGAMLLTLENVLIEGAIDMGILESYYNNRLSGTLIPRFKPQPDKKLIPIPEARQQMLIELAHEDPTLGFFFTPAHELSDKTTYPKHSPLYFGYLPEELHAFLLQTQLFETVTSSLVPHYVARSREVIKTIRGNKSSLNQQSA